MLTIKEFEGAALRRSFAGISGIYVLGMLLMLVTNVILARTLSVTDFGRFGFVLSLATVLALPAAGGMPLLISREVARYTQQGDWSACKALIKVSYRWVALVSSVLVLGLLTWTTLAGNVAAPKEMFLICILVSLLGLDGIRVGVLKGLNRPVLAEALAKIIQPLIMIAGFLTLASLGLGSATNALWWYATTIGIVFFLGTFIWLLVKPTSIKAANCDFSDLPRWRKSLIPLVFMSASTLLVTQAPIIIAGFLGKDEVIAYLRIAERGMMIVVIPAHVLYSIIVPYIVSALNSNEINKVRDVVRQSSSITVFVSVPIAVFMALFGETILAVVFGAPYGDQAFLPMVILSAIQLFSVGFGQIGMLMLNAGREKEVLVSSAIGLSINVGACFVLIKPLGAVGAALGVAAGIGVSTIINVFMVKHHFGFIPGFLLRRLDR